MTFMNPEMTVTKGTIADVPPRPSIIGMLEAAGDEFRRMRDEKDAAKIAAIQRTAAATDMATKRAAEHAPQMLAFLRLRRVWTWTPLIRDEIQRSTGVKLDCGAMAKVLRARGVESRMISDRLQWRAR